MNISSLKNENHITKTNGAFATEVFLRPNISRFEALKYSGKMNIIENKELLDEIINLYEEKIPILVNGGLALSEFRHKTLVEYLESRLYLAESHRAEFLKALKTDDNLKYIFQRIADRTPHLIEQYHDVIEQNEKLIALIEKELK